MAWFFRAIEEPSGGWTCRRGRSDFDTHDSLEAAIAHLRVLAACAQPSELIVHWVDGTVEAFGPI